MPLSQATLDSLTDKTQKRKAAFYNNLAIAMAPVKVTTEQREAVSAKIKQLAQAPEVAQALEGIKSVSGPDLKYLLEDIYVQTTNVSSLPAIIDQVKALPPSKKMNRLIEALEEYHQVFANYRKEMIQAKGLYGCLVSAERALNYTPNVEKSAAFESAILTGVIVPTLMLFEDMEKYGDLTADSLEKIQQAKSMILQAKTQFHSMHARTRVEQIDAFIKQRTEMDEKFLAKQSEGLNELEATLVQLQADYRDQFMIMPDAERATVEEKLASISKEIGALIEKQEVNRARKQHFIQTKVKQMHAAFDEENLVMSDLLNGVNDELDYISRRVQALDKKKQVLSTIKDSSSKKQMKKGKKAIRQVQKATDESELLGNRDIRHDKKMINKAGGRLLVYQDQSKVAAMGHSDGLCGGYSAEFLEVCSSKNWSSLSMVQKLERFKSITNPKESFNFDMSTNMLSNDLYMRLESGLRWDIQSTSEFHDDTKLFSIDRKDKAHATHRRAHRNQKAFFERYVAGVMEQAKPGAKLFLLFFDDLSGHAVGLNAEKDGFLFHDSNTGYIYFEDKDKFSKFLVKYLYENYPGLSQSGKVLDFTKIRANINKYNLKAKQPEESVDMEAEPEPLADSKSQKAVLERMDTVRTSLEQVQQILESARQLSAAQLQEEYSDEGYVSPKEDSDSDRVYESEQFESDSSEEVAPYDKQKKTAKPIVQFKSDQQRLVKQAHDRDAIHGIIEHYMGDIDSALNDKQVLKQTVLFELNNLLQTKNQYDLSKLKQICASHNLPKCEQLVKDIEKELGVKQKRRPG